MERRGKHVIRNREVSSVKLKTKVLSLDRSTFALKGAGNWISLRFIYLFCYFKEVLFGDKH
jgi:hypothetical protein